MGARFEAAMKAAGLEDRYGRDDRREAALVERAFEAGINSGINLGETDQISEGGKGSAMRDHEPADPGLSIS
jgi:hypothetical protein